MMDFQTLKFLNTTLVMKRDLDWKMFINPVLVSFYGHNVFSIFEDYQEELLDYVHEIMDEMQAENEIKKIEDKDTPFDRRIYRVMTMATPYFFKDDVPLMDEIPNLFSKSTVLTNQLNSQPLTETEE